MAGDGCRHIEILGREVRAECAGRWGLVATPCAIPQRPPVWPPQEWQPEPAARICQRRRSRILECRNAQRHEYARQQCEGLQSGPIPVPVANGSIEATGAEIVRVRGE